MSIQSKDYNRRGGRSDRLRPEPAQHFSLRTDSIATSKALSLRFPFPDESYLLKRPVKRENCIVRYTTSMSGLHEALLIMIANETEENSRHPSHTALNELHLALHVAGEVALRIKSF